MVKCAVHTIDAAVRELHFTHDEIPVYFSGSILTKAASDGYLSLLKESLGGICQGKLNVKLCSRSPVDGAVQMLKMEKNTE